MNSVTIEEYATPDTEPHAAVSAAEFMVELNLSQNATTIALLHELETAKVPKTLLKIRAHMSTLSKQLVQHKRDLMNTGAELRALETVLDKYLLHLAKKDNKGKTKAKRPSGFARPVPMPEAMAEFMGVEVKGTISRPEATKVINKYIKQRNLQCADNKKTFIPDGALMKLLQVNTPEPIAYFDIQRKLNVYFNIKEETASELALG